MNRLALVLLMTALCQPAIGGSASLELKVSGNKIVTVIGNCPVFFKGVNLTSLEWKDVSDGPVLTSAQTIAGTWGANIMRMPVNQDRWLGTACGTNAANYQAQYDGVINWCNTNNVYVMLDLHWSDTGVAGGGSVCTGGQHDMPDDNSATFWTSVATRYANNTAVLFDIYNEPKGIGSWSLWRNGGTGMTDGGYHSPGMQSLLNTIRATGAKNIVVAGGLNWAFDLTGVPANALIDATGNGVVYATHIYPWKAGPCDQAGGCFDAAVPAAVHNNYAVMVTEFGQDNWNEGVPYNSWTQSVMTWAKANTNGYIAWCMHNSATPCLITDWAYTPSSWFGVTVKADMLATSAGGCVGTPTFTATRTSTRTPTFTYSPTRTVTRTSTPTPSSTNSPAQSPTLTVTPTLTNSPFSTQTYTSTISLTPSRTSSPVQSPTFTNSSTRTITSTRTFSPSFTPTYTLSATRTSSPVQSITFSPTTTNSPAGTLTNTPPATPSSTVTLTPTLTSSLTASLTSSQTSTALPTSTPLSTFTFSASPTVSDTPRGTYTQTPTLTATASFSSTLTATPTSPLIFTATKTSSPTPTYTSTLTTVPGPFAPPTALANPGQVVETAPSYNPQNGGRLLISGKLDGSAEGFELRLFSKAETAVTVARVEASYGPGWQNLAFDGLELCNGIYYYQLRSLNGGKASGLPRIGKVMILK